MPRILHAADIHAGRPASREFDRERAEIRRREIDGSLARIVDVARREDVDLLLLSGDLFEHANVRMMWAREAAELLRSIPHIRVFVSPGNHDPYLDDSPYRAVGWPPNVTLFTDETPRGVAVPEAGVTVYGVGWRSWRERRRLLRGFFRSGTEDGILMVHGDLVSSHGEGEDSPSDYLPITPSDLESSGMGYVALGHIHSPKEHRFGQVLAVYPGCPEPLDFGDSGPRGVYLVTMDLPSVEARFLPLSTRQARAHDLDVTGLFSDEELRGALLSLGDASSRGQDMWSVRLRGTVDPEVVFDIPAIQDDLRDEFFSLRLRPMYVPGYDRRAIADPTNRGLEGRFARRMLELQELHKERGDERSARVAEHALYYGLDALRQGRVSLRRGRGD